MRGLLILALIAPAMLAVTSACELAEVIVAAPEDVLIAEVHFTIADGTPRGIAVLHRTAGPEGVPIPDAVIRVRGERGTEVAFREGLASECLDPLPSPELAFSCHVLDGEAAGNVLHYRATLDVQLQFSGGGELTGRVVVPGDFDLVTPDQAECVLAPGTVLGMEWTPSAGTWAYLPEAEITGLREVLEPLGIEVPLDPLILQGLSISEDDTTIHFPTEFGVFDRFSGDTDLLLALRDGLPAGTSVDVLVAALERNAVNWVRGGDFNPSGQVRIPSLFGDGIGVVGATVLRSARLHVGSPGEGLTACGAL